MTVSTPTSRACRAAAQLGRTVNLALDESPLTPAAYRLLAYLSTGSAAATVLAEKLAVSRPTITAATDWLVDRGLAQRTQDDDDRRRVAIAMTEAGARALEDADRRIAERLLDVMEMLDPTRAATILDSLDDLSGALDEYRVRRHERMKQEALTAT